MRCAVNGGCHCFPQRLGAALNQFLVCSNGSPPPQLNILNYPKDSFIVIGFSVSIRFKARKTHNCKGIIWISGHPRTTSKWSNYPGRGMLQVLGHRRKVNEVKMHRPVPADLQTCSLNSDYMSGAAQSCKREPFLCQALFLHRRQKRWNIKVPTIHFSVNKLTNGIQYKVIVER